MKLNSSIRKIKVILLLSIFNICYCNKEVEIITLKPQEFTHFKELRIKSVEELPAVFGSIVEEETSLQDEDWKRRLKLNMLFVKKDNQIIGMIGAVVDSRKKVKHSAHIISFYVLPQFRGKKIGLLLITTLINKLKNEKNVKRFTLHVTTTANKAIKLYQELGFEIIGKMKHEYHINNTYYDQYIMMLSYIPKKSKAIKMNLDY